MKLKIFALAFSVCFVFCFSAAAFFVFRFSKPLEQSLEEQEEAVFLEVESASFLLVYEEEGAFGPFTIVNFDAKAGRIPVFTFSKNAAFDYGGVTVSAGALFSSVSPEVFAGAVETNLGIELCGYFIWNRESAEAIIGKTGGFDYVLPEELYYRGGTSFVHLLAGVQNMTAKKICDVITYPKFSEGERCDVSSRMAACFFNRRLKRFLPESGVYPILFNYTKTDISAFDKEKYAKLAEVLCSSGGSLASHITNDTEKDVNTGLLYFSDTTKNRVKKYFG